MLGESLLGNLERSIALWNGVEDGVEVADTIHHLIVLGDDMRKEALGLFLYRRTAIECPCVVSQATGLAHLLEHHSIHATTIVLVKQGLNGFLGRIPLTLFIMVHAHIDVLGIVRCNENLVLGC